jgi:hypothetical protein
VNNKLQETIAILQNLGGGGGRPPVFPGGSVELYHSDSCSSELIATVSYASDCTSLKSARAWGVKINGQCYDISDVSGDIAC